MSTDKERIMTYVTKEDKEKITKIAKKNDRSVSNYVNLLIKQEIKEYEQENGEIILEEEQKQSNSQNCRFDE